MTTISADEFVHCCNLFLQASNQIRDGWNYVEGFNKQLPYLVKKFTKNLHPLLSCKTSDNFVLIECQVIYSESYANPVLYFTACKIDGQILKLEDCWKLVDTQYHSVVNSDAKWSFLTQVEHPIFFKPCFQLHPCHTKDFMSFLSRTKRHLYVVSWLSIVLPVLGLDFPIENYHKFLNNLKLSL